jgi:hypothetical protein
MRRRMKRRRRKRRTGCMEENCMHGTVKTREGKL